MLQEETTEIVLERQINKFVREKVEKRFSKDRQTAAIQHISKHRRFVAKFVFFWKSGNET